VRQSDHLCVTIPAVITGKRPWRPLVHVEDISAAFLAVLQAPRKLVHGEAFNVGLTSENYRIRKVAEMVREVVPGSELTFAEGAGPDLRGYRVDCGKLTTLPGLELRWTVPQGVAGPRQGGDSSYSSDALTS